jgi:capsular polysaccharide biosynthesis protein
MRRRSPLVPARSRTISEYVQAFPGCWHVVYPAAPLDWQTPRSLGEGVIEFALPTASSEYGVLELDGGSVYGRHGWVLGPDGAVFSELSWYAAASSRIQVPKTPPEAIRLEGACLSLVSDWSCRNYSHFLLDGLGRLALFLAAGFSLSEVDHVYCPTAPTPQVSHYFDRLGIPTAKRVWAATDVLVETEKLFVPSLPATALTYPAWLPRFFREAFLPERRDRAGRRLYVSRRGYGRQAVEELEVERVLLEHGFEIYEAPAHPDQPEDFDDAEIVVGPHGAGLANLVFCRPGTRVVEIVPTDNAHPFYFSLARAAGLDYAYLMGRSTANRSRDAFGPSPYNFDVDLEALAGAVQ